MPTTFANTIDGNEILAKRAECDYAGADIQTTYATKSEVTTGLASKQDTISDLATIRSGAADGATAVQPGDLATVATTGDYDDLSNKPTIPAAQVNSDWNASSGVAEILNKPTILPYKPVVAGTGVRIVDDTENNRIVVEADETVLSSTATAVGVDVEIALSENFTNFERIKIFAIRNPNSGQGTWCNEYMVDSTHAGINFIAPLLSTGSTNLIIDAFKGTLSGSKLTINVVTRKTFADTSFSTSSSAPVTITQIVGINRIVRN